MRKTLITFLSFILSISSALPVFAQVKLPSAAEPGIAEKSLRQSLPQLQLPPEVVKPELVIIEDSRKLIDAGAGPSFFVRKIEIVGNTVFDTETLAPIVDLGEGLEVTLGILSLMAQEVSAYYSLKGYFLTKAYIPRQEIIDNVVTMEINEGRIGKINVEGNKKIKSRDLLKRMQILKAEKVLSEQTLERTLMELNDQLGVKVRSVLKPGELPGTSDLTIQVTESTSYTYGFDADSFGSSFTGRNRFGSSFAMGNILTFADLFSFRGVRSDLGQNLLQFSYTFPLTDSGRTTLRLGHTYSEQQLGASLAPLNAGGQSNLFNIELGHALFRSRTSQMALKVGFDSKDFRNFTLGQLSTNDEIRDIYFGVGGNLSDQFLGRTFFDLKVQRGISGTNQNSALPSRFNGNSRITVASLNLTRLQGTGFMNSYFILKGGGQVNSSRALSPDQFSVGGFGTVRGYPLSEIAGDMGYTLAAELFFPFPFKILLEEKLTLDQILTLTAFIEHGGTFIRDQQPGEINQSITGAGFGIQINIPKGKDGLPAFTFSASMGFPIQGPTPSDGSKNVLYFNGGINF